MLMMLMVQKSQTSNLACKEWSVYLPYQLVFRRISEPPTVGYPYIQTPENRMTFDSKNLAIKHQTSGGRRYSPGRLKFFFAGWCGGVVGVVGDFHGFSNVRGR